MTEQLDRRPELTRAQILRAAARQFAHRSYNRVSLDDILNDAEVTKGAMYFHFRSKHQLAAAIVEQRSVEAQAAIEALLARKLTGLEALIDISLRIATDDLGDESTRAGFNLIESIGRVDGMQSEVLRRWVAAYTSIARKAVDDGDIPTHLDPEDVAHLLVAMYMGIRQTSSLWKPERFLRDLEKSWSLALPGFVADDRMAYLGEFIKRRTAVAIKNATPLSG
ncbi:TetR family transcriptional regulator [Mycolicibacterium sp. XJ1819]